MELLIFIVVGYFGLLASIYVVGFIALWIMYPFMLLLDLNKATKEQL